MLVTFEFSYHVRGWAHYCWSFYYGGEKPYIDIHIWGLWLHFMFVSFPIFATDPARPEIFIFCRLVVIWSFVVWDADWTISFPWWWWRWVIWINTSRYSSLPTLDYQGIQGYSGKGIHWLRVMCTFYIEKWKILEVLEFNNLVS